MKHSYSIAVIRLVQKLKELIMYRSILKRTRTDYGPEFLSKVFTDFSTENGIELQYIQPGKSTKNAHTERFNRTSREDLLEAYLFGSLSEVNDIAHECQVDYNENLPHTALNGTKFLVIC